MNKLEANLNEFLNKIKTGEFEIVQIKELLEHTYFLLENYSNNEIAYNLSLKVICHIADLKPEDLLIKELLKECIIKSRIFLYKDKMLKDYYADESYKDDIIALFSKSLYTLDDGTILTKTQKELFDEFQKSKKIVVSAPTSFGKSKIIEEIIKFNDFKNILIILPTLALSNEFYMRFRNIGPIYEKYSIIKTTNSIDDNENNIFILTPEKALLLLDEKPELKFDFFVMDEVYKIDHEDERKKVFSSCLYELTRNREIEAFYLLGPYFKNFSQNFLDKTGAKFLSFHSEIVQKDEYKPKLYKTENANLKLLIDILNKDEEQTLVYFGDRGGGESRANKILNLGFESPEIDVDLIKYLEDNIHKDWNLIKYLKKGIAFHHSGIPRFVQNELIDSFNKNKIKVLFCTTTITEGVNTTAKKIVIFDNKKGRNWGNDTKYLSKFEVKNMKGRAGRFLEHFIGEVYVLTEELDEGELENIEFSFFDNKDLEDLEINQAKEEDLKEKNLSRKNEINNLLFQKNIHRSLIKKNKYVKFEKQITLIEYFRNNVDKMGEIYFEGLFPGNVKFNLIFDLCFEYLFDEIDKDDKNYTPGNLKAIINYYVSEHCKGIPDLINRMNGKNIDTRIRQTFTLISRYFEFKLPKYLRTFENIYKFVNEEKSLGLDNFNLTLFLSKLEFGTIQNHEIILKEAGVPNNLIDKLSSDFKECQTLNEIQNKIKSNSRIFNGLSDFEKKMIKKYI